jgi:hypothetical protein
LPACRTEDGLVRLRAAAGEARLWRLGSRALSSVSPSSARHWVPGHLMRTGRRGCTCSYQLSWRHLSPSGSAKSWNRLVRMCRRRRQERRIHGGASVTRSSRGHQKGTEGTKRALKNGFNQSTRVSNGEQFPLVIPDFASLTCEHPFPVRRVRLPPPPPVSSGKHAGRSPLREGSCRVRTRTGHTRTREQRRRTANPGPERSLTVSNGLPGELHEGHPNQTERHVGGITGPSE